MVRRVKFGHHFYYVVTIEDLKDNKMRGKNVVLEGEIETKPLIEFLPMELPSWRTTFKLHGLSIEFAGSPCIGVGDTVKVYGRFVGDGIIATAIETERALFTTEE